MERGINAPLVQIGSRIVELLIQALEQSNNETIQKRAIIILGEIEDDRAIEPLINILKKE